MKFLLVLLFLGLGNNLRAQNVNQVIPFELTESGHMIIKASVEGVEGNFIFDTGAGHNLLFKSFSEKLPPKKTDNFFVAHRATGEALSVPIYKSKSLMIGGLTFDDQIYSTFDIEFGNIAGLISLQPFKETIFTIDFEKKIIQTGPLTAMEKKNFIPIQVADYAGKALDIFTNVKLNDQVTIQVLLDGGAGKNSFWISSKFMETLHLDSTKFEMKERKSEFEPSKSNKFYIGSIESIKSEYNLANVENPKTAFVEGLIYEGKTGIDWLGKKIAISLAEKKIYILK